MSDSPPLDLFGIYGVIGRSGTTFVRNVLCRTDDLSCLTSEQQFPFLKNTAEAFPNGLRRELAACAEHDIRHIYGKAPYDLDAATIRGLVFKMPLPQIIWLASLDYAKAMKPIFVLRHPVAAILSATKPEFVKKSMAPSTFLSRIMSAYSKMGLSADMDTMLKVSGEDVVGQTSLVTKLNLQTCLDFMGQRYDGDALVLYFEDFSADPAHGLTLLADFTGTDHATLARRFAEPFFKNTEEEGGIVMDAKLDPARAAKIFDGQPDDTIARIWEFIAPEARAFGYEADWRTTPRSFIGRL